VIDSSFEAWPTLAFARQVDRRLTAALPRQLREKVAPTGTSVGHGAAAAHVAFNVAPNISRIGFFPMLIDNCGNPVDDDADADCIERAVAWGADVIVCPWSDRSPPPLNERVLKSLNAVLAKGRGGLGAIVVYSSGRPSTNDDTNWLRDDALANHPSVLTVTACDRSARVYREKDSRRAVSVFGPAVGLCAPGWIIYVPHKGHTPCTQLDETSLAAPLVAGAVAAVIGHNPYLRAFEVREILQMCAVRPARLDRDEAPPDRDEPSPRRLNEVDRQGHNCKLGYGRVDVARACAAAVDPICNAFEAVRLVPELPLRRGAARKSLRLADWWWRLTAPRRLSRLLDLYQKCRPTIVCVLQRSARLRQAVHWAVRHCRTAATDRDVVGVTSLSAGALSAAVRYGAYLLCEEAKHAELGRPERQQLSLFAAHLTRAATVCSCGKISRRLSRLRVR